MASESWSVGTTTSTRLASSSSTTFAPSAGASALTMNVARCGDHWMMSIFSPCNSFITACTREPRMPTQAPTGSMEESFDITAILARRLAAHVVDIGAHAVALAVAFVGQQLVAADDRFRPSQIDGDVAVLDPLD